MKRMSVQVRRPCSTSTGLYSLYRLACSVAITFLPVHLDLLISSNSHRKCFQRYCNNLEGNQSFIFPFSSQKTFELAVSSALEKRLCFWKLISKLINTNKQQHKETYFTLHTQRIISSVYRVVSCLHLIFFSLSSTWINFCKFSFWKLP